MKSFAAYLAKNYRPNATQLDWAIAIDNCKISLPKGRMSGKTWLLQKYEEWTKQQETGVTDEEQ